MVDIELEFCGFVAEDVPELTAVLPYEPERLPKFPCVTMMWVRMQPEEAETGHGEDVAYDWRVRLYIALNDYKVAQDTLKALLPKIHSAVRHRPTCNGLVDFLRLIDEGQPPEFATGEGWVAKDVILRAVRTET